MAKAQTTTASGALAATARWTAGARAVESSRADALFRDPWAADLAGPDGIAWASQRSADSLLPIVLRTRYFDDWLLDVLRTTPVRQVVLLAAGLDTRAFRLPMPTGTRCFEVDRPAVLRAKQAVLSRAAAAATCERTAVGADLTGPWGDALTVAGFAPDEPTAWLLEGFLFYLASQTVLDVLDRVSALSAPGSRLGFDVINGAMLSSPWTHPWVEMQAAAGAPWIGTLDDPVVALAERGWAARLTQAGQPDADHGRWTLPVLPVSPPDLPHSWFVTAERT